MHMKKAGFLLLICGFLVAAYATALDIVDTNWTWFLPAAIGAGLGVLMIKRAVHGEAKSAGVLTANRTELAESLQNIVMNLGKINESGESLGVYALRHEIDQRLRDDLRRFADARESLIHLFGLQLYADLMSNFATGERYINRVWSASADGYDAEARDYLARAEARFRDAQRQLQSAAVRQTG
jgi:hypothetical protein